jgi:DNA-binding XRE family transcriptional regulator
MTKIDFGKYTEYVSALNKYCYNICKRFSKFSDEAGEDLYDRRFFAEPIITFAIECEILELPVEDIYRKYVLWKLSQVECPFTQDFRKTIEIMEKEQEEFEINLEIKQFCIV